jgi:hypothetical protein
MHEQKRPTAAWTLLPTTVVVLHCGWPPQALCSKVALVIIRVPASSVSIPASHADSTIDIRVRFPSTLEQTSMNSFEMVAGRGAGQGEGRGWLGRMTSLQSKSGKPLYIESGQPLQSKSGKPLQSHSGKPQFKSGKSLQSKSGKPIKNKSGKPFQSTSGKPLQSKSPVQPSTIPAQPSPAELSPPRCSPPSDIAAIRSPPHRRHLTQPHRTAPIPA